MNALLIGICKLIVWVYYNAKISHKATVVWKATKVAERLVEEYMVRIETCSTFNDIGAN